MLDSHTGAHTRTQYRQFEMSHHVAEEIVGTAFTTMSEKASLNVWSLIRESRSCDRRSEGSWVLVKLGTTASEKPISQQLTLPALGPENFILVDEEMRLSRPYLSVQAVRRSNRNKLYGFGNRESFADEIAKSSEIVPKNMTLGLSRQPANSSNKNPSWQATNVKVPAKRKFTAPRQVLATQPKVVKAGSLFGCCRNLAKRSRADGQAAAVRSLGGLTSASRCDSRDLKSVVSTKGCNEQDVLARNISSTKALVAGPEADIGQPLFQFASGKIVHPTAGALSGAYTLLGDEPDVGREQLTPESLKTTEVLKSQKLVEDSRSKFRQLKPLVPPQPWKERSASLENNHGAEATDVGQEAEAFQFASGKLVRPTAAGTARAQAVLGEDPDAGREPYSQEDGRATDSHSVHKLIRKSTRRHPKPLVTLSPWKERRISLENIHQGAAMDVGQEPDVGKPLFQFASGKIVQLTAAAKARAQALLEDEADVSRGPSSPEIQRSIP